MSPLIYGKKQIPLVQGKTVFDYADDLKIRVPTSCGRTGECHECIVEIKQGSDGLTDRTESEKFLKDRYRLACQAAISDAAENLEFSVLRRQPKILTSSIKRKIVADPITRKSGDFVCYGDQRLEEYKGSIYGLAIDLGTTTVAMNLVDLEKKITVFTTSFENPQKFGGSDVMHRISYDGGPYHGELRKVMLSSINFEIGDMCRKLKIHRRRIYEAVLVGNSTMRDIVFGVDVQTIGEKPYKSKIEMEFIQGERKSTALNAIADDLGIRIFPKANVYGGPLIASHVGSDVSADLLAIGMDEMDESVMLVDVGTNTEVIIGNRHRILAASCPAGPAFEGGEIKFGMPGYEGAVEAVRMDNSAVEIETIGNADPEGICGSGLIDLLAELRRTQRMTELGVFNSGENEFTFASEQGLTLSRADISALAQAKSANFCGQWIVLRAFGQPIKELAKFYLAGGFANYINAKNAIEIGFLANVNLDDIEKVGNASLEGATIMLLSGKLRNRIEDLVLKVEHIELETTDDFFDLFVEGCQFKRMDFKL